MSFEYIKDIVNIEIEHKGGNFSIETFQGFYETETMVMLSCAEYVPQFQRGFVCNIHCNFLIAESENSNQFDKKKETIENLVLVYINKSCKCGEFPKFEYVFYK